MSAGPHPSQSLPLTLSVNGITHHVSVDPRRSLLDFLREDLGLTGSKKGCDHGQCGACTIHINGERRLACLQYAVQLDGAAITTIEGVSAPDGGLHPLQDAFIRHDALQCGYCTPGQIMSGLALISEGCPRDPAAIREAMSGNLCRCGAHNGIIAAIREVAHGRD
ncbi:(2Fe-2S)-binding protein [Falsigemmobacter faecalis]|uniref:(2Fe-2S)-binding protein n=1 Tax=Falsigemmobacter faecalis TaxID=2488730 RepID=A0A3P3DQL2_9RHOB|nr:(2Fe-2S)-binding protein [Falsigemmobacter faecalis]RRH76224.1 (2Fe-2S)-binding protein [Falsigemmobacter faecalis]